MKINGIDNITEEDNMKKIIILSIAFILITTGFFVGCTDQGTVNIDDIFNYPNRYLGEEISVKGQWINESGNLGYEGSIDGKIEIKFSEHIDKPELYTGGIYTFTGTLMHITTYAMGIYYLDNVTKIVSG